MLMNKWLSHTTAAIALLALTLTGCHDRLRGVGAEPDQGAERTSLTVTLSTEVGAPGSLRGVTDAQDTEVPGATGTGEDKVEHLTLAMQPGIFLSSDKPKAVAGTTNKYTVLFKDILYPGPMKLSCSVYLGQRLPGLSLADFYANKEVTYDQLKTLTNDTEGFVMTSAVGTKTITLKPGITEPSKANGNYLPPIDVERVVSKGAVSFDKNNIEDKDYRARYAPTTVGIPEAAGVISEGVSSANAILPIGWTAVGGAKSAYLFRNNAGRRTLGSNSDADCGLYTGLQTLSAVGKEAGSYDLFKLSDYMSMTDDADIDKAKAKPFLFFTEFTGMIDTGKLAKGYNGSGDTSGNNGVSVKGGSYPANPYFLEHALTETSTDRTSYPVAVTFSDVAYAKVLTQTKAVRGAMIDESDKDLPFYYRVSYSGDDPLAGQTTKNMGDYTEVTLNTPYAGPSGLRVIRTDPADAKSSKFYPRRYLVEVSEDWYTANKGKTYPATGELNLGKPAESIYPGLKGGDPYRFVKINFKNGDVHWFFEVRDRVLDYYVGVNDGNVYNSLLAARAAGNTKSRKYTLGQAYYLVPFNAQRNDAGMIYNCDTRRNNIYDLRITAIEGMGYNYDPVDPTDPYMPKPEDNPDEPDPVVPSVNTSPQKIRVKARILKWNYIHYSADLKAMTGDAND